MPNRWYSIGIETAGPDAPEAEAYQLEELAEVLTSELFGRDLIAGPSVGVGGLGGGPSVQLSILADSFDEAVNISVNTFETAMEKVGFAAHFVARVDVMTEDYFSRWVEQPSDELVGVTEIASLIGVSKQRVSELRGREGFPSPVAELAAGPVWRRSMLERFVREWPRKPGRPRRDRHRLSEE